MPLLKTQPEEAVIGQLKFVFSTLKALNRQLKFMFISRKLYTETSSQTH